MGVLVYIIVLFLVKNPWWYLACLGAVLLLYHQSKIPLTYFMKGLRGILLLLLFTFVFRMISTPGREIAHVWIFTVTREGIGKAVSLTARIALMISGASLLSYTTTPKAMADGMEKAFSFLEKVYVPVQEMAVMVMIAFRFIPVMIEEMNVLMDAQAARGVEFEKCSVGQKCKNVGSLLMPLFLSAVRRSSDLAMAMEARGYTGEGKTTHMYPLQYTSKDRLAYGVMAVCLIAAIGLRIW
jgi:energy-coupling factor transport system permease protein